MNSRSPFAGAASRLCLLLLVAILAASPTLMSAVMERGHEIPKLIFVAPLALFALAAALMSFNCRDVISGHAPSRIASYAIGVFVCMAGITTALSSSPADAFFGSFFRLEGLLAWLAYGAIFFALLASAKGTGAARALVDTMIFASVVPACHALQQSMALDFIVVVGRDPSRANGTMGNPVQLAQYLSLIVPLTIARILQITPKLLAATPWAIALLAQLGGLWVTQTRGPLLACVAGFILLAMLWAALTRRRSLYLAAIGAIFACAGFLAAINMAAPVRSWAQSTTFVSRMVFDLGRDAGTSSKMASRSVISRLGAWQAGVDTFAESSFVRQLFGYGPESAYPHYYPHIPPSVIRSEDYRKVGLFDRLHADVFDIGLNFGLLGWTAYVAFFFAVVFGFARRMFESGTPVSVRMFAVVSLACGASGAGIAGLLGFPSAIAPAACLGIGIGWMMFLGLNAWRMAVRQTDCDSRSEHRDEWALSAGLMASLLTFWLDAQISIPLFTSRVVAFAVAALLLAELRQCNDPQARVFQHIGQNRRVGLVDWGFAFALVAACSSFLPVISTANMGGSIPDLGLRLISIGVLALLGVWRLLLTRQRGDEGAWWRRALVIFGLPLAYAALHLTLRLNVDEGYGPDSVSLIAWLVVLGPMFIIIICIVKAHFYSQSFDDLMASLGPSRMFAVAVLVLLGCSAAVGTWKAQVADIAMASTQWNVVRDRQLADKLVELAISEQPREWQYTRIAIQRHLSDALATLTPSGLPRERYEEFAQALRSAEAGARSAVRLEPDNPWPVILLANILQVRALRLVRGHDVNGGADAEIEAEQLFGIAQRLFPAQPTIYRSWAQLKFDGGMPHEGYRLLDKMELIIPEEPEPYVERIRMAQRFGDVEELQHTLERATKNLNSGNLAAILNVAKMQR